MTSIVPAPAPTGPPHAQAMITVPASQPMVALLGASDEHLRLIEAAFSDADILVRGNQVTITGTPADVALIEVLFGEMLAFLRTAQPLSVENIERSITLLRSGERPTEILSSNIRRCHRQEHDRLRHRTGGHRQDLPRCRQGGSGAAGQAHYAHCAYSPGGRGR